MAQAIEWQEPPQMSPGAPESQLCTDGHKLLCAYQTRDASVAVVEFSNFLLFKFGYPNDEVLQTHDLYGSGLSFYAFHVIEDSQWITDIEKQNSVHPRHKPGMYINRLKHWVVTFHDETLEVIAMSASVVATSATTQLEAILEVIGKR